MTSKELLATIDARVWAEEFCRIVGGKVPAIRDEREWVEGWFANAITAGEIRALRPITAEKIAALQSMVPPAPPDFPPGSWPDERARYERSRPSAR